MDNVGSVKSRQGRFYTYQQVESNMSHHVGDKSPKSKPRGLDTEMVHTLGSWVQAGITSTLWLRDPNLLCCAPRSVTVIEVGAFCPTNTQTKLLSTNSYTQ